LQTVSAVDAVAKIPDGATLMIGGFMGVGIPECVETGDLRRMSKLALVATTKTVPGKRDEYLKHLKAHSKR
jgi:acetate CoA/acetoacetate CoA-transferase alpha subunit